MQIARIFSTVGLLFLSTCSASAQAIPNVHLIYLPGGAILDRNCPDLLKIKLDPNVIKQAFNQLPNFQAEWEDAGRRYLGVAFREVGLPFPYHEMLATLTVCPVSSMSDPLLVNVTPYLLGAEKPLAASYFPLAVFHELMHHYVRAIETHSELRKKYSSEPVLVLSHLHVLALEELVLLKLGEKDLLNINDEVYHHRRPSAYSRAWEIVNEKENYMAFIDELKKLKSEVPPR
jgi:hypothetical protein